MIEDEEAWPEEIQAIEDIESGKTKMEIVTADEFITELKELEKEECCPPIEYSDQDCIECARLAAMGGGHIPMKAMKDSQYCSDCANILFNPP